MAIKNIRRRVGIAAVLVGCLCFFVAMCVLVFVILDFEPGDADVESTQLVGRVQSVLATQSPIARTQVQTESGAFTLKGRVIILKGAVLSLEHRADKHQYLCDAAHHCYQVLYVE